MTDYLNLAPFAFFSIDDHGKILAANEATCNLLGYAKEELVEHYISAYVSLGTRIFFQTHFFPMLLIRQVAKEVFITLSNRERQQIPVLLNAQRRMVNGRAEIVCGAMVIENRNKYENEIIAAKKYAEQALQENTELQQARQQLQQHAETLDAQILLLEQRNADLQQVNKALTHNMQEPLRKLMVLSSMLLREDSTTPGHLATHLERIAQVAQHTRDVVKQVQRFVQIDMQELNPQPVDLNTLVTAAAEKARAIQPAADITMHCSPLPVIMGFTDDLSFLFSELLHNAIKFRHPQRLLQLHISTVVSKDNKFRMLENRYRYTDFIRIRIQDNGTGIPEQYKDTIFQLFQKLNRGNDGLGLGLALCKKIIERHQGFITVDSQPDKGSEFCCHFPIA
ncbi:sigma-B regulation protein RsbU (phosphoserine phosphatase) [Cnuella takakiae]|uniref:histidine kinase n=1 Tax=Cnuella takakiae TaxID=1302690 RepID=A0A1M5GQD4_9BACT|nr:ATP-binding protein [Cnuella takakiae]OLY90929.1 hypothetical protein BUE76_02710 [Cnuella takakiae]SHG05868.1 sigma-B regulation protein RsbU (phosphoserine phosphatase) [Cnuella takakiae]